MTIVRYQKCLESVDGGIVLPLREINRRMRRASSCMMHSYFVSHRAGTVVILDGWVDFLFRDLWRRGGH